MPSGSWIQCTLPELVEYGCSQSIAFDLGVPSPSQICDSDRLSIDDRPLAAVSCSTMLRGGIP